MTIWAEGICNFSNFELEIAQSSSMTRAKRRQSNAGCSGQVVFVNIYWRWLTANYTIITRATNGLPDDVRV